MSMQSNEPSASFERIGEPMLGEPPVVLPPIEPEPACEISWQPNALSPVFYGVRDYGQDGVLTPGRSRFVDIHDISILDGAPTELRVFFPSLDGAVFTAPILEHCGRYPLMLFVHGDCSQNNPHVDQHYREWFYPQSQLAESGYVVAVANYGQLVHPSNLDQPAYQLIEQVRAWMRESWEHREVLMPEPATGIYGHSYGAMIAALAATPNRFAAFAGLSGAWEDWSSGPLAFEGLTCPKLFVSGGPFDLFTNLGESRWDALPAPKHWIRFDNGLHWDYLPAGSTPCNQERGDCPYLKQAASDFVITFFSRYLPPELSGSLSTSIPETLIPPPLDLSTFEKAFYGAGHLTGVSALATSPGCGFTNEFATPADRIVPNVLELPHLTAANLVRQADLVPRFTGINLQVGSGLWVSQQSPAPGTEVTRGSTVRMHLRSGLIP
jgi:hypothetical protein